MVFDITWVIRKICNLKSLIALIISTICTAIYSILNKQNKQTFANTSLCVMINAVIKHCMARNWILCFNVG